MSRYERVVPRAIAGLVGVIFFGWAVWPHSVDRPPLAPEEMQKAYALNYQHGCLKVLHDESLYTEGWDTLAQPRFWQRIMQMPPDTVLVNIAKTRQIVDTILRLGPILSYERTKKTYEDSVKRAYGMSRREELYFTHGRNHFYRFGAILPEIDRAVEIFWEEGVDPWYAQAILLIESPGRLQFSVDGAYGAFQLMEGVAREVGLTVTDSIDERRDFEKSARGAARLIKRTCLPHTRNLCNKYNLDHDPTDTWFRLLTMHVYHAGIGNVRRVVRRIKPTEGGIPFITKLWQTKSRRFGNASQNYSQLILASMMEMDRLIEKEGLICPPALQRAMLQDSFPDVSLPLPYETDAANLAP